MGLRCPLAQSLSLRYLYLECRLSTYLPIYLSIYLTISLSLSVYIYIHVCMHACMCMCLCMCLYLYISYISTNPCIYNHTRLCAHVCHVPFATTSRPAPKLPHTNLKGSLNLARSRCAFRVRSFRLFSLEKPWPRRWGRSINASICAPSYDGTITSDKQAEIVTDTIPQDSFL